MERGALHAMADVLNHRGPDGRGYYLDPEDTVAFAHNRLRIIDLSEAGHQPMIGENGDVVLNYNGELYNFLELRGELKRHGYRFRSQCDTEVVLRAWEAWGIEALDRFDGMFAFAVWQAQTRTLTLVRDSLGIKPLYYAEIPGSRGLAFASEVKAFSVLPGFHARANRKALRQFLEFGYTFDERETAIEGVFKLPPGHLLRIVEGQLSTPTPYFEPVLPGDLVTGDRVEELYETLRQVVGQHLYADVPVALLLSGGLDSSLIAAIAARNAGTLTTISMGFADSAVDERPHARLVSNHVGSSHHEVVIRPEEIPDELEQAVSCFDDLFADWGTLTTRILYRRCRDLGIKVVLVGEGADELFGGYPVFRHSTRGPRMWRLFQLYRQYAGRRFGWEFGRFSKKMTSYLEWSNGDLFQAIRLFETRNQLPNNYVIKVDRASMSMSVEARVPYLDRRVARIAYRTPASSLLGEDTDKLLLRRVAERYDLLPSETTWRRKFGGSIAASWMDYSPEFRAFAEEVILSDEGWVDELGFRRAMQDYFAGRGAGYPFPHPISIFRNLAWRLLLLNLWSRRFGVA